MKKGFTLVELLAVIVILSVLILIAGTNIFGAINKSRDKVGDLARKGIIDAAITYAVNNYSMPGKPDYMTCTVNHDVTSASDTCTKSIKVQKLIDEGYFNDSNGSCNKNATVLIYKYKSNDGKIIEFRANVPQDVCK